MLFNNNSISRRIPRLVSQCLFSFDIKDFTNGPDYLKAELDSNCQQPDWQKISQNLIGKFRYSSSDSRQQQRLYPKHIDHFIVNFTRSYDIVILLKFVQFLKHQDRKISISTYDAIMKAVSCLDKPQDINDDLRKLVYDICDDVKKLPRLPLDIQNCLNVTLAKFGELGEKQTLKVLTDAGTSGIKSLCLKVMAENKPNEALNLMKTDAFLGNSYLYRHNFENQLRDDVYIQFIKKYGHNSKLMEELFNVFHENLYFVSPVVKKALVAKGATSFREFKEIELTSDSVNCPNCGNKLPSVQFSHNDCYKLKKGFINALTKHSKDPHSNEMYLKTKPGELKRFEEFLKDNSETHIDIVVDGLNLGTSRLNVNKTGNVDTRALPITNSKKHRNFLFHHTNQLTKCIEDLKSKDLNVCLIHRHWLRPSLARNTEFHEIHYMTKLIFLLDKYSSDDYFTLASALSFGPNTHVVSNDLFRSEADSLQKKEADRSLLKLFTNWQYHRLIRFSRDYQMRFFVSLLNQTYLVQSFTLLEADLRQDINEAGFVFC